MAECLNAQFANQKLSLDGISIRFDLPPDMVVLSDSGKLVRLPLWVVPAPLGPDVNFIRWDIRTQSSDTRGSTTVSLELMQSALKISIKPALIIEPLAASAKIRRGTGRDRGLLHENGQTFLQRCSARKRFPVSSPISGHKRRPLG